jgi:CheY-like chemotaxis protein
MRVLIIDDNPAMQQVIATILESHGYETVSVYSIDEAQTQIDEWQPNLICCDLLMPVKSGLDFLQERLDDPRLLTIPVIILTGSGEGSSVEKALQLGADAVLEKPFSRIQLLDVVNKTSAKRT